MGAWIETPPKPHRPSDPSVAPYMKGAGIETLTDTNTFPILKVVPYTEAGIETATDTLPLSLRVSPSVRERGLKRRPPSAPKWMIKSLPTWERGLKRSPVNHTYNMTRRSL